MVFMVSNIAIFVVICNNYQAGSDLLGGRTELTLSGGSYYLLFTIGAFALVIGSITDYRSSKSIQQ